MTRTTWLAALFLALSISIPGSLRPVLAEDDRDESRTFSNFSLLRTIQVPVDQAKNTFQQLRFFDISWVDPREPTLLFGRSF
jgi:hypothetical protein